ncbi:hypothetical protein IVB69_01915 [Flavobacterium sp. J49]|uniref:hypothetical protein n=1 Tax=Flavobacterium sp. J49 TaxID=2718534 RepID=UPI0015935569|nr:hypothetical protein [Flavobacterium sp. J49]MBF6640227.1 hypothetical protein [Flavobacterium sp. J49]NIC01472.1 hypothetical protein [Flavobacterium sp. J49]
MKTFFIIFSIFCFEISQSQSVENDWKEFNCENWTVKIDMKKSSFLGKEIQYNVTFINTKGNSRKVNYYVYKKSDIDTNFNKEVEKYLFVQSCFFQSGKFNFKSFYLNDYYYFLVPCHCSTKENKDCENLAENIEKYIIEK